MGGRFHVQLFEMSFKEFCESVFVPQRLLVVNFDLFHVGVLDYALSQKFQVGSY